MSEDEREPLLGNSGPTNASWNDNASWDHHVQFSELIGIRPRNFPPGQTFQPNPESLYQRAIWKRRSQNLMYQFTATFTNVLLLSQVVIGAAITGLGASNSSHILVTCFGAFNTIIAGVVAFLKSRGQPMRARMFRDDLERVVDEIENSAIMWLGISKGVHGYDAIDIDEQVTVRGEVARLTRLYDRAVKTNTLNDPDMYSTGAPGDPHSAALRDRTGQAAAAPPPAPIPAASPTAAAPAATPAPAAIVEDPDASPATKAPEPAADAKSDTSATPPAADPNSSSKDVAIGATTEQRDSATDAKASSSQPAKTASSAAAASSSIAVTAPADPDESPATTARP